MASPVYRIEFERAQAMTTENEWVKLPDPAPKMLPAGTVIRGYGEPGTNDWELVSDHVQNASGGYRGTHRDLSESGAGAVGDGNLAFPNNIQALRLSTGFCFHGSEVVKVEADDLGDTPEHLRELLSAARKRVPGAVVGIDEHGTFVVWGPAPKWYGWIVSGVDDARRSLLGWDEPSDGGHERGELRSEIENGRCYPTADARRLGEREFGMVFEDQREVRDASGRVVGTARTMRDVVSTLSGSELDDRAAVYGLKRNVSKWPGTEMLSMIEGDELFRDRLREEVAKTAPMRPIVEQAPDPRPTCAICPRHMDPRHDGDPTCSPECHQAMLKGRRERPVAFAQGVRAEADRKIREREEALPFHQGLDERIAAARDTTGWLLGVAAGNGSLLSQEGAREAIDYDTMLRAPRGQAWPVLNPAAAPCMGKRAKRKPIEAPAAWPPADEWEP